MDSQPPKAASASASTNRHVALLDSQPPKAASASASPNRHAALLDLPPPKATPAKAVSNRHVTSLNAPLPKAASANALSNHSEVHPDLQPPNIAPATQISETVGYSLPRVETPPSGVLHSEQTSSDSARIDDVPHRPPPVSDFVAYNDYVSRLSEQEYYDLFFSPLPNVRRVDESGSDVDSNERYIQEFEMDSSHEAEVQPNTNNTIGSRERVLEYVAQSQREARNEGVSLGTQVPYEAGLRQRRYPWDENHQPDDMPWTGSNGYEHASSSTSQVVIQSKASTVAPPPTAPTHRMPSLEVQMQMREARRVEMMRLWETGAIQQPPSTEGSISTDSGEYTIRDGSLPSSGGYQRDDHSPDQSAVPPETNATRESHSDSSRASTALATLVVASALGSAEGREVSTVALPMRNRAVFEGMGSDMGILGLGILFGVMIGFFMAWSCCGMRVQLSIRDGRNMDRADDLVSTTRAATQRPCNNSTVEPPRQRRRSRNHKGAAVFMTPDGECVHGDQACPTLRYSSRITTRHMCTQCCPQGIRPP